MIAVLCLGLLCSLFLPAMAAAIIGPVKKLIPHTPPPPITHAVLGTMCGAESPTLVAPELKRFHTHMIGFGVTGTGKSKFIEQLCRELSFADHGYALIDPNGDTADDVFRWLVANYKTFPSLIKRVHYLKLGDLKYSFRYNPFEYRPDPNDPHAHTWRAKLAWLDTRCEEIAKIIIRKLGQSEAEAAKEVRFKRWLKNVLFAIGIANLHGHKLSIAEHAIPLLSPGHNDHPQLYAIVEPLLTKLYRDDFEKLRNTKSARQQEDWVESSINRLRETLCHQLVREVFLLDQVSINIREIIQRGDILIVSLGKTEVFHEEAAKTLGSLLIREINDAVRTAKRENRKRFFMLIDEAHNFVNEDMMGMMREARKYHFTVCLFAQQLDNFRYGDVDLVPTILGMCRARFCFGMRYQPHAEELALSLAYPLLDFTELVHTVERDDGYEWVTVVSQSEGKSTGQSQTVNISKSEGLARSQSTSHAEARGKTVGRNWNTSLGTSYSRALSTTNGRTVTITKGTTRSDSRTDQSSHGGSSGSTKSSMRGTTDGSSSSASRSRTANDLFNPRTTDAQQRSRASSSSETEAESSSKNWGKSHAVSVGRTNSYSRADGTSSSSGVTETTGHSYTSSHGGSESNSVTLTDTVTNGLTESVNKTRGISIGEQVGETAGLTFTPTPLRRVREVKQSWGVLKQSVNDQIAKFTADLMRLPDQHCLVSIEDYSRCFFMRVADVYDPLNSIDLSPQLQDMVIDHVRSKLAERFPYQVIMKPNVAPAVAKPVVKPAQPPSPFKRRRK